MEQRFFSSAEAATFLGVSKPLIEKLVARKAIPSYKIGKRRLFDREELVEWVKAHRDDAQVEPQQAEAQQISKEKGGKAKSTPQDLPPKERKKAKNDLHYSDRSSYSHPRGNEL